MCTALILCAGHILWLSWCENLIKQILEEFSDSEAINKVLQDIMVGLYVE